MTVADIIRRLRFIANNYGITDKGDQRALSEAQELLGLTYNLSDRYSIIKNNSITSVKWLTDDIETALEEKGFEVCDSNVDVILNYPGLIKYLQSGSIEGGWEVIYNVISDCTCRLSRSDSE